uniref:(northern house mosquito) hypothetical protein n=1 Tax=Culex pipiens TaxID=7175 RepID=A0A8D8AKJ3_CULPI
MARINVSKNGKINSGVIDTSITDFMLKLKRTHLNLHQALIITQDFFTSLEHIIFRTRRISELKQDMLFILRCLQLSFLRRAAYVARLSRTPNFRTQRFKRLFF